MADYAIRPTSVREKKQEEAKEKLEKFQQNAEKAFSVFSVFANAMVMVIGTILKSL